MLTTKEMSKAPEGASMCWENIYSDKLITTTVFKEEASRYHICAKISTLAGEQVLKQDYATTGVDEAHRLCAALMHKMVADMQFREAVEKYATIRV